MPTAIIIGAGPAGLTAALELLRRSAILPIVLEKSDRIGGICQTANYKGNRMDIGGHRFFSKSDRVMNWWLEIMPLERGDGTNQTIQYENQARTVATSPHGPTPDQSRVMLIRTRKSRIYFLRRFFDYPLRLSADTARKLGLVRTMRIGFSYLRSLLRPIRNEATLEDFFINRFGRELYHTFFKSYTEKVWGMPCHRISAAWGAQRIKGLDAAKAIKDALGKLAPHRAQGNLREKNVETSLLQQFLYPKFGPGHLWETVAAEVEARGGEIHLEWSVDRLEWNGNRVTAVRATHARSGETRVFPADYFFSTMPVRELIEAMAPPVPAHVRDVSRGLMYRDFITVGLLLSRLKVSEPDGSGLIKDNWIYIQEPDVRAGRLQIFNNWSPWLVADPHTVWVGLEYFCNEGDDLWAKSDAGLLVLGSAELQKIGLIAAGSVLDGTVIRMPKAYPAYFGSYDRFQQIRDFCDGIENLFLIGRNGMHRYNNQDHSMLAAMTAVDNIVAGRTDKGNIWQVNTETDYHEDK